jgi:gluconate 2-dehydrogenase subunit 3-like protein
MSNLKSQIPNQTSGASLVDSDQLSTLAALANGIIPPDESDAGAAEVNAAAKIAERIAGGVNAALYREGLALAESLAHENHHRAVCQLNAAEIHELLAALRDRLPAFFKQLRLDVSALYLSDPAVWQRIGFPGPSTASGGYPDFDQRQFKE